MTRDLNKVLIKSQWL